MKREGDLDGGARRAREVPPRGEEFHLRRVVRRDADFVALGPGLAEAVRLVQLDRVAAVGRKPQGLLEGRCRGEREVLRRLALEDEAGAPEGHRGFERQAHLRAFEADELAALDRPVGDSRVIGVVVVSHDLLQIGPGDDLDALDVRRVVAASDVEVDWLAHLGEGVAGGPVVADRQLLPHPVAGAPRPVGEQHLRRPRPSHQRIHGERLHLRDGPARVGLPERDRRAVGPAAGREGVEEPLAADGQVVPERDRRGKEQHEHRPRRLQPSPGRVAPNGLPRFRLLNACRQARDCGLRQFGSSGAPQLRNSLAQGQFVEIEEHPLTAGRGGIHVGEHLLIAPSAGEGREQRPPGHGAHRAHEGEERQAAPDARKVEPPVQREQSREQHEGHGGHAGDAGRDEQGPEPAAEPSAQMVEGVRLHRLLSVRRWAGSPRAPGGPSRPSPWGR